MEFGEQEIKTKCNECGVEDEFTHIGKTICVDDDWEQQCSEYPKCNSNHARVLKV